MKKKQSFWTKAAVVAGALLVGFTLGTSHESHQPPASVTAQLERAQKASKTPCWAEWKPTTPAVDGAPAQVGDTGPASWEVLCGQ